MKLTAAACLASLMAAIPLTAEAAPQPIRYPNCAKLNAVYQHGVGMKGAKDKTASGKNPVRNFYVKKAVYQKNTHLDRDNDKIACEKH